MNNTASLKTKINPVSSCYVTEENVVSNDMAWAIEKATNTPLMQAVQGGQVDIVQWLINRGADVNAQNKDGLTSLHFASSVSDDKIGRMCVDILVAAGAKVNVQDNRGNTPLMSATMNGNMECIEALSLNGGDFSIQNDDGVTPLKYVLLHIEDTFGKNIDGENLAKSLLKNGADINETNDYGDTLLTQLIISGNRTQKVVDFLLNNGMDANKQNREGFTPLMISIIHHADECFEKLVRHGVDLNIQNEQGINALMYAAMLKKQDMVYTLIDNKASVKRRTKSGETFWGYMSQSMRRRLVEHYNLPKEKYITSHASSASTIEQVKEGNYRILEYKI